MELTDDVLVDFSVALYLLLLEHVSAKADGVEINVMCLFRHRLSIAANQSAPVNQVLPMDAMVALLHPLSVPPAGVVYIQSLQLIMVRCAVLITVTVSK